MTDIRGSIRIRDSVRDVRGVLGLGKVWWMSGEYLGKGVVG